MVECFKPLIFSFPTIWMVLEDIVLSEISQHRKAHTTYSYLHVKFQTVKVLAVESENNGY